MPSINTVFHLTVPLNAPFILRYRDQPDILAWSSPIRAYSGYHFCRHPKPGRCPVGQKINDRHFSRETLRFELSASGLHPVDVAVALPHGTESGWYPHLLGAKGGKMTKVQWVNQLLLSDTRFQNLGPSSTNFLSTFIAALRTNVSPSKRSIKTASTHLSCTTPISAQHRLTQSFANVCIIPASYTGGFAHRSKRNTEGLAIVRHSGKPDCFIAMTCNKVGCRTNTYRTFSCFCPPLVIFPSFSYDCYPRSAKNIFEISEINNRIDAALHSLYGSWSCCRSCEVLMHPTTYNGIYTTMITIDTANGVTRLVCNINK